MDSSVYYFKNPLSWIAILAPLLIFSPFLALGLVVVILTTIFVFKFSQNRDIPIDKSIREENIVKSNLEVSNELKELVSTQQLPSQDISISKIKTLALSESECLDQLTTTSEESEVEADLSLDFSDGSISDEESLIEIAINPSGHFIGLKYEKHQLSLQKKFHDGIMELLSEFNEEDNLIEIDISIGSIKCSRFEMEA